MFEELERLTIIIGKTSEWPDVYVAFYDDEDGQPSSYYATALSPGEASRQLQMREELKESPGAWVSAQDYIERLGKPPRPY